MMIRFAMENHATFSSKVLGVLFVNFLVLYKNNKMSVFLTKYVNFFFNGCAYGNQNMLGNELIRFGRGYQKLMLIFHLLYRKFAINLVQLLCVINLN